MGGLGRLVVWDSNRGTPKESNLFHFRGFQESKPLNAPNQQAKPLAEWYSYKKNYTLEMFIAHLLGFIY